jgi:hypothetical protein
MSFRSPILQHSLFCFAAAILVSSPAATYAEDNATEPAELAGDNHRLNFERDIRPILRAHCLDCHGAVDEMDGNLDLRLVRFIARGGDSGAAIVPGNPDDSLFIRRIRDGEMPPGEAKVPAEELRTLERWVAAGAPTARPEPESIGPGLPILPEDRQWWAFQPIRRPAVATADQAADAAGELPHATGRARTPIDALLVEAMPAGLAFSPDAEKRSLMMRLYFDLVGLPPSTEQIDRFMNDASPDAYERLVDELLQSPHYGERWGRHWLDIAGYSDSEGRTSADAVRPWAYKYRDYVIRSLNEGKPLDQFIHEQIAGDELAGPIQGDLSDRQIELLTATGFMRMAADGTGSGDNSEEARNQVVADVVKIVTSSMMGLSFACAQCHDHRYDPISHTDYFALRAVFDPALDWKDWRTPGQRYVSLYTEADRARAAEIEAEAQVVVAEREEKQKRYIAEAFAKELEKYEEPLREQLRQAYETPEAERTDAHKDLLAKNPSANISAGVLYQYNQAAADDLQKDAERIAQIRAQKKPEEFLRVLTEPPGHAPETLLFYRGDHRQPKQAVLPAAPTVLCPEDAFVSFPVDAPELPTTGRRLAFARWLTGDQNPITARVMANRVWLHLMGRGLVQTPSDFGRLGARPTHPELLDWLAAELIQSGWNLKQLQRVILVSTAYRQSSRRDPAMQAIDDDNRFYWRSNVRRLDAEVVRDRLLATTGQLDPTAFGPATPIKEDETGQVIVDSTNRRRSIYIQQRRTQPVAMLQAFDAPVMETNCEIRPASTVATQSLMLMNGDLILDQATALATAILDTAESTEVEAPNDDSLAERLPPIDPPAAPIWGYGYGSFDETAGNTVSFQTLPHFAGGTWQGGPATPDPTLGWVLLHAGGGHTGNNPGFAAIRRWTAPIAGNVRVTGTLQHASEGGDGVSGRIVSSRSGLAGQWIAQNSQSPTAVETLSVEAGDTIDFITDCRADVNADSFSWVVEVEMLDAEHAGLSWKSDEGFQGPAMESRRLSPAHLIRAWERAYCRPPSREELEIAIDFINRQCVEMNVRPRPLPGDVSPQQQAFTNLCQALLTSNEFLYID